ncbi:MAG: S9 family peptidase [Bacteroidetes bacterium]|nr:S9 family peptidase [Bacteroidota bacterium]
MIKRSIVTHLFICIVGVCLLATDVRAQDQKEPIEVSDLLKIRQLGNITASPNGRYIAYTLRSIISDDDDDYVYRSELWILGADRSAPAHQMTYQGASSPVWHPDSERITFLRSVDGKSQLFQISVYGGEANQILTFEHGISEPQWSSDGRYLLFASVLDRDQVEEMTGSKREWTQERPARASWEHHADDPNPDGNLSNVRAWLNENESESNPRLLTRLNFQGELDLSPDYRTRHYFVADFSKEEPSISLVTSGHYSFSGATWLMDNRQIIVSGFPETAGHPDRELDRDLFIVDVENSRKRLLLDIGGYRLTSPIVSPTGRFITFQATSLGDPGYAQTELGYFPIDGLSPPEMLTLDFDRSIRNVRWSHDDWFVYFTAPSEGGVPLYRVSINEGRPALPTSVADSLTADSLARTARSFYFRGELLHRGLPVEQLTTNESGVGSYDITKAMAYMTMTQIANPSEMYTSPMNFDSPFAVTSHNSTWLKNKALSIPESFRLRRDTIDVQYWVMPPTFQVERQTYPLLVSIHGGPASMWGPGEATMWHEFQFFAAKGYGLVYSNPRGSGGYGHGFRKGNFQDWGVGPADDVLAVASEAVRRTRWVDSDRQVVTGGSYAGYLTAWIISQDDRFKAAVAQRGVYDLSTFFGEGNAWRLVPTHFGGYPWELGVLLRANSPITFVDQIRTPLLIMHADNDLRTGVIQSEVLYKSLKVLERQVEYIRYPKAGHDLSRTGNPKQRIDRMLRIWEFMERYIGDGT